MITRLDIENHIEKSKVKEAIRKVEASITKRAYRRSDYERGILEACEEIRKELGLEEK